MGTSSVCLCVCVCVCVCERESGSSRRSTDTIEAGVKCNRIADARLEGKCESRIQVHKLLGFCKEKTITGSKSRGI